MRFFRFLIAAGLTTYAAVMASCASAQSTRSALTLVNNSVFTANGVQAITGPKVNSWNQNILASVGFLGDSNTWTNVNQFLGTMEINGTGYVYANGPNAPVTFTTSAASPIAANSIVGNNTGSTGGPYALTVAQTQAMLGIWPSVPTNTALKALASTYAATVLRRGFTADGDSPMLVYQTSNSACSLNAGLGDNGSQVQSSDGKCWVAQFDSANLDVREWGAVQSSSVDSSAAVQAAFNYMNTLPFYAFGLKNEMNGNGATYATSIPLILPEHTKVKNFSFLALAGASWDASSQAGPTYNSITYNYGRVGILTVRSTGSYDVDVSNVVLDCNYISGCQGLYTRSANNITYDQLYIRHWAQIGNGFIADEGATFVMTRSTIFRVLGGAEPGWGIQAQTYGMAVGLFNCWDSTLKDNAISQAGIPLYAGPNTSMNTYLSNHIWQSFPTDYYSTGTVSISNGSTSLVGVGTGWSTSYTGGTKNPRAAGGIYIGADPTLYVIAAVVDDTHITLATPFGTSTVSGVTYNARDVVPWTNAPAAVYDGFRSNFIDTYWDSAFLVVRATSATTPIGMAAPQVTVTNSRSIYAATASSFADWIVFTTSAANTTTGGIQVSKSNQWDMSAFPWTLTQSGAGSWAMGSTVQARMNSGAYLNSAIESPGTGETDYPHNQDYLGTAQVRGALTWVNASSAASYALTSYDTGSEFNDSYAAGTVAITVTGATPQGLSTDIFLSGHAGTIQATGTSYINGVQTAITLLQNKLYHITCHYAGGGSTQCGLMGSGI